MIALTAYNTGNLGDAIQTLVMSTVTGPSIGLFRGQLPAVNWGKFDATYVANGWFDDPKQTPPPAAGPRTFFAGFHTNQTNAVEWCRGSRWPVGTRDPATAELLRAHGVKSVVVTGCPTLLLPRFDGQRNGVVSVDMPNGPGQKITHNFKASWPTMWKVANERLAVYQTAAEVHTTRLHAALPCLAMGTPVRLVPHHGPAHDARFSLWHWLGLPVDELVAVDARQFLGPLLAHLELFLGRPVSFGPPVIPTVT